MRQEKQEKIVIVGGGIVGSTAAYYLSKSDHRITLIDCDLGQATKAAAGIICPWLSQRRNKAWYRLASCGAAFYPKMMADLQADGVQQLPYKQTGTLVFKDKLSLLDRLEQLALERKVGAPQIGAIRRYTEKLDSLISPLKANQYALLASGGGRVDGSQLTTILQKLFFRNGGRFIQGQAKLLDSHRLEAAGQILEADHIILAAGAWLPELLAPLGYQTDVRPQKGQLLEIQTDFDTDDWPGCMLHGEIDILPFEGGKVIVGASHEDDQGYDVTVDNGKLAHMQATASSFMPALADYPVNRARVGIRAYTSDYSPFYGPLADTPHLWTVSGLGSSGLTSGPFIAWQIAAQILGWQMDFDTTAYSPEAYISKS